MNCKLHQSLKKLLTPDEKINYNIIHCRPCGSFLRRDNAKRKTIDITSTFKPVLREPSKLNFNASPVITDTTPRALKYNIPGENLLFAYQPAELKPLSLDNDSSADWGYSNFIKSRVWQCPPALRKSGV